MLELADRRASTRLLASSARDLRALVADLRALAAPTEQAFTGLGASLGRSMEVLDRLTIGFADVSSRLDADEAAAAVSAMSETVRNSASLASGVSDVGALLLEVERAAVDAAGPLATLGRIVDEVRALATNAKMLVAQIEVDTVDFTVFTVEVGRLQAQASGTVRRAAERLRGLGGTVVAARQVEERVARNNARSIEGMRSRLERSVGALVQRQQLSRRAVIRIGDTSRDIARRVAQCVGELQINDMTSQRIEHVWKAIELVCDIIDPDARRSAETAWTDALGDAQKATLAAAVCRLQARQLDRAAQEFTREVDALKTNLRWLSGTAAEVMSEAEAVIGADDGGGSFVGDLRGHAAEASALLVSYSDAQAQVRDLVGVAAKGFTELADDIRDIQSIDEDMRLMGLNATLKCGRLGSAGRALGVVAQELRVCSRRTEEEARPISDAVENTVAAAVRLEALAEEGQATARALSASLVTSMRSLDALGAALDDAFGRLREDCVGVSALLTAACEGLVVDRRVAAVVATAVDRLSKISDTIGGNDAPPEAVRDNVLRLLESHYTMASERVVHELFADGSEVTADSPGDPEAAASVDEFFF